MKDGSTTLTSGTHYTVSYSNNTNAGTATVTITGKGNYTGTKTANFTINAKSASNLTISAISAVTYNGSAQTPTVTVKDGTTTLTSGTHYTVAYSNNTNAGTATVTITGKGNYTSTKTANFTINKVPLTVTAQSYTITQDDPLPMFECTYSGFVNGETESVLNTQPTITCQVTDTEIPGTYTITPSGAAATNYSINYVNGTLTVNAMENVSITMATSSGAGRELVGYSSKYGLDFTNVSEVKAYVAMGYTQKKDVLLARVNIVPANTGVVLRTTNPGVTVNVPTTTEDVYYANLLLPAVSNVTVHSTETIDGVNYTNLMIGKDATSGELGFITFDGSYTFSNKSYLHVPTSYVQSTSNARLGVVFVDSETTDIESLLQGDVPADDAYYDLQGRKVTSAKKGLYIRNGKKVYIK